MGGFSGSRLILAFVVASATIFPSARTQLTSTQAECVALGGELTERNLEALDGTSQIFLIWAGSIIFFMQTGFALLEAGSVDRLIVTNILFKNTMDVVVGTFLWWSIGYAFAFGLSDNDFIGNSGYFLQHIGACEYAHWFFQLTFANAAVTIVSGAIAGRTQLRAYITYSAILTGLVYPCVVKWTWSYNAWLARGDGDGSVGYSDFAGSGVVHVVGGSAAFIACVVLGPRTGWTKKTRLPGHSMPLAFLGTMILFFGFLAFNGGSVIRINSIENITRASAAVVNTVLAAAGGALLSVSLTRLKIKRWSLMSLCNGLLAGMVSICASADSVLPWAALVIGMLGAATYFALSIAIPRMGVDDAVEASAVHFGGGCTGLLLRPFFDRHRGLFYGSADGWNMLAWACAGVIVIAVWTASILFISFKFLGYMNALRISDDIQSGEGGVDKRIHLESSYELHNRTNAVRPSSNRVGHGSV